ncbi:MAG: hypothetical protein JWN27_1288 [Candidatus Eremiobacteraeota bacterium]|nr:hypothetical protein [Candidatus Eremiobacteraeota bacterium]
MRIAYSRLILVSMRLAHRVRLDPTPAQQEYFRRACDVARFAYNWALAPRPRLMRQRAFADTTVSTRTLRERGATRRRRHALLHQRVPAFAYPDCARDFGGADRTSAPHAQARVRFERRRLQRNALALPDQKRREPAPALLFRRSGYAHCGRAIAIPIRSTHAAPCGAAGRARRDRGAARAHRQGRRERCGLGADRY